MSLLINNVGAAWILECEPDPQPLHHAHRPHPRQHSTAATLTQCTASTANYNKTCRNNEKSVTDECILTHCITII